MPHLPALIVTDDLEPNLMPVKIGSTWYVLMEASAGAATSFRNAAMKTMRVGADGKPVADMTLADSELALVSGCLAFSRNPNAESVDYATDANRNPQFVPSSVIRGWKSPVIKSLFKAAKEISPGLMETDDETIETLEQTKADTEKKLAELYARRAGRPEGDPAPKGTPASTTAVSG